MHRIRVQMDGLHHVGVGGELLQVDCRSMSDACLLFGFCFGRHTDCCTLLVLITLTLRQLAQNLADALVRVDADLGERLRGFVALRGLSLNHLHLAYGVSAGACELGELFVGVKRFSFGRILQKLGTRPTC